MSQDDAEQDAAVILIQMRERWLDEKVLHLPPDRQDKLAISWARLRLIDKYETEFTKQGRTTSEATPDMIDPASVQPRLTTADREDVTRLIERLPERHKKVAKLILFDGHTQQEVAELLKITQPAVCATYKEARALLRKLLADYSEVAS